MADNIDRKRVTLHPLKPDGTIDESVNLYPKTFVDGVVDRDGNEVDIATQAELDEAIRNVEADLNSKTSTLDNKITQNVNKINHINQNITVINNNITNIQQDVADIQASEATKEYVENKFNSLATVAKTGSYNDLEGKPTLAEVAHSGDYDDLINKPNVATQEDLNIAVANIEQEIQALPKGDVTTEQLNEALANKADEKDLEDLEDIVDNVQSDLNTLDDKKQNVTEIDEGEFFNIDFPICDIWDLQDIINGFTPEYFDKLVEIGNCVDNFGEVWNFDIIDKSVVDVIVTNGNLIYRATVTGGKSLSIEDAHETNTLYSVEVPNFILNDILDPRDLQTFTNFLNNPSDFSDRGLNLLFMNPISELTYKQACKYHKLRVSYYKDENIIPYVSSDDNWTDYPDGLTPMDILDHIATSEKILLPKVSDNSNTYWYGNWPNDNGTFYAESNWDKSAWRLDDYSNLLTDAGWNIEPITLKNTDEGSYSSLVEFETVLATKNDLGLIIAYNDNNYIMCLYWFNTSTVIREYSLYFNKGKDYRDGFNPKGKNSKSSIDEPTVVASFEYVNVEETNISKLILNRDNIRGFVSASGGSSDDNPRIYFQFTENMKNAFADLRNTWPIESQGNLDPDLLDSLRAIHDYFDGDNGSHTFTEPNGTNITCSYKHINEADIFGNMSENDYFTFSRIHSNGLEWEVQCVYLDASSHMHINYVKVFVEGSWHYWVPHLVPYICDASDYFSLPSWLNYSFKELYAVLFYSYCLPDTLDISPYVEPIDIYDGVCTSILRNVYSLDEESGDYMPMIILDYIKGLSLNKIFEDIAGDTLPERYHFSRYNNFEAHMRNPDEGDIYWDNYATPNMIKKLNLNTYTVVLRPWFSYSPDPDGWNIYSYRNDYIKFEMWGKLSYLDDDISGSTNEEVAISTLPYISIREPQPPEAGE